MFEMLEISKSFGGPQVTKDGVTVAKEIELENELENMGAQMVKEVASKTNDLAGDGTTTATILAQSIVTEGLKNVAAGANPMDLKRGIDKAVTSVVDTLEKQSVEIGSASEKILQVASISANNDISFTNGPQFRKGSPDPGLSILITSAPKSANRRPQNGPATVEPSSRTRTPCRGPLGVMRTRPTKLSHLADIPAILQGPYRVDHTAHAC